MPRYLNQRRRRRIGRYARGLPARAAGMAITGSFSRMSLVPQLAGEAKRFVSAFVESALSAPTVDFFRIPLTTVPRNIASTAENSDFRVGRMVNVKGVTYNYFFRASTLTTQTAVARFLVVWQKDPDQNILTGLTTNQFYSPIGATRAVRVLVDKYVTLSSPAVTNGINAKLFKGYRKINRLTKYDGSAVDGTDISTGAIVVYTAIDPAQNGTTNILVTGNGTLSYRELQ